MRSFSKILVLLTIGLSIFSCYVPSDPDYYVAHSVPNDLQTFSSVDHFSSYNEVPMQIYNIDGSSGGTFTTPQGTVVTIPSNAFLTQSSVPVTGTVTVEFRDLYKKSDMLFADMPTMDINGAPLKSGGEFFIRATFNGSGLLIAPGKEVTVVQPGGLTGGVDLINAMDPFVVQEDTSGGNGGWVNVANDTTGNFQLASNPLTYVYTLYAFSTPADSGTWCNSDNSSFFASYPQTTLTLQGLNTSYEYGTQVFLIFTGVNSMVHVYEVGSSTFTYLYAPEGLQCTMVALGIKDGIVYSSFMPITIGSNQTVEFTLQPTTETIFKSSVEALN